MTDPLFKDFPWIFFREFIDLRSNRFDLLKRILKESGLEYRTAAIAGNSHFIIAPPPGEEFLRRRPTILLAHYDRAPGSPGANDNSAGVFMLIETAMKLKLEKEYNWRVILTDKEELKEGEPIMSQGAYTLARGLKDLGMENARIFSFDACGTGDTLIISTTLEYLMKREDGGKRLRSSIQELRETALKTAGDLRMTKVLLAPTPFSDDAGFFRAGFAAQTITMLPSEECTALVSVLRKNPAFADALVSRKEQELQDRRLIPRTWRSMNGPSDSYLKLTPKNFRTVLRFAGALCRL